MHEYDAFVPPMYYKTMVLKNTFLFLVLAKVFLDINNYYWMDAWRLFRPSIHFDDPETNYIIYWFPIMSGSIEIENGISILAD